MEFARKEIDTLLECGLIVPSKSEYGFPVLFIPKRAKAPGEAKSWRMAVDYRILNSLSNILPVHLPRVKDVLNNIAGHEWYVCLDLKAAFYQMLLLPQDRHKCAFVTPFGTFEPLRSSFGLMNAGNAFSKLMNEVLGNLNDSAIQFYLDDVVVAANSIEELLKKLQIVLNRLKEYNLTLDPKKVQLCKREVTILGFKVSKKGIQPSNENTKKIADVRRPGTKREIKSFLGLCNYFRFLIKNYAHMVEPLVQLTRPKKKFEWTEDCEKAWLELKQALTSYPVVKPPNMAKTFYVNTDASSVAIAALLLQKEGENYHIVESYSRKMKQAERQYPSFKSELLAIKEAVFYFREYLIGKQFVIISDAKSLGFNLDMRKQSDVVARWLLELSNYEYRFEHIDGETNPSDFMSRQIAEDAEINEKIANISIEETHPSHETLRKEQNADTEIKAIIDEIKAGTQKKRRNITFNKNKEGLLTITKNGKERIIVPASMRKHIINLAHSAHPGVGRTIKLIYEFYTWKNLYRDVANFVKSCHNCLMYKTKNIPNNPPIQVYRPNFPNHTLALDLMGPFTRSGGNHKYILNIIDLYSRFVVMTPLTNITAHTICEQLEKFFAIFGGCVKVLSDNGTQFASKIFKDLLTKWGAKHAFASIAYPLSNSICERSHSTIKGAVAAMTAESFDWHINLRRFQLWYNCTPHSQTNYAPAQLFLIRDIKHPMYPDQTKEEFRSYKEFLEKHQEQNETRTKLSMEQQLKCQKRQLKNARFVRERKFEVGQRVYMKNQVYSKVLRGKFTGPYIIKAIRKRNNVEICRENDPDGQVIKLNTTKIIIAPERFKHLQLDSDYQKLDAVEENAKGSTEKNIENRKDYNTSECDSD